MGETWHWDRLWPSAPGEPRGDKPSPKRGRRVRAFLGAPGGVWRAPRPVPGHGEGEQGLPRRAFACVGQRVAHCPLPASSPRCLVPARVPSSPPRCPSRHCRLLSSTPGMVRGAEPPAAPAPEPTGGRSPARSSEHTPAVVVPGWWLPPSRDTAPAAPCTPPPGRMEPSPRHHQALLVVCTAVRGPPGYKDVRCLGCLVPRSKWALTCLPGPPCSSPFPSCPVSCWRQREDPGSPSGAHGDPMAPLPRRRRHGDTFSPAKQPNLPEKGHLSCLR